jgi:hypothetical protein
MTIETMISNMTIPGKEIKFEGLGGLGVAMNRLSVYLSVYPVAFFGVSHGITTYTEFSGLKTLRIIAD